MFVFCLYILTPRWFAFDVFFVTLIKRVYRPKFKGFVEIKILFNQLFNTFVNLQTKHYPMLIKEIQLEHLLNVSIVPKHVFHYPAVV
jgi:hypothetical protein